MTRFLVPWKAEERRYVAGQVKNLRALFTAQEVPSVLAHGTPVLIGIVVFVIAFSSNSGRAVH